MVDKKRRILNNASSQYIDESRRRYDMWISRLEELKEEADISDKNLSSELGHHRAWYSNKKGGGGTRTHDFSLVSYFEVLMFLGSQSEIKKIKDKAKEIAEAKKEEIEEIRIFLDIEKETVNSVLCKDHKNFWYSSVFCDGEDISLMSYIETLVFLEIVTMLYTYEGYVEKKELENMVEEEYIREGIIDSLEVLKGTN